MNLHKFSYFVGPHILINPYIWLQLCLFIDNPHEYYVCMYVCLYEWMNEWLNEWMNERMNERMNEWMSEWMIEWMTEYMNAWMNHNDPGKRPQTVWGE